MEKSHDSTAKITAHKTTLPKMTALILVTFSLNTSASRAENTSGSEAYFKCVTEVIRKVKTSKIPAKQAEKNIKDCTYRELFSKNLKSCKREILKKIDEKEIKSDEAKMSLSQCPEKSKKITTQSLEREALKSRVPIGKVKLINGSKEILSVNKVGHLRDLEKGSALHRGDFLFTLKDAAILVSLDEGTQLIVSEQSILLLSSAGADSPSVHAVDLHRGKLRAKVRETPEKAAKYKFKLRTRDFTMGIRGTDFIVASTENSSKLQVINGEIEITDIHGIEEKNHKPEEIEKGQTITLKKDEPQKTEKKPFNLIDFEMNYEKTDPKASKLLESLKAEAEFGTQQKEKNLLQKKTRDKLKKIIKAIEDNPY